MMNDLISREVAKQAMRDAYFQNYGYAIMVINDVPAVDAAPKWINAKDSLPEDDSRVLAAIKFEDGRFTQHIVRLMRLIEWMETYNGKTKVYWMQLPLEPKDGDTA